VAAIEYFDGDALNILRRQKKNSAAFARLPEMPADRNAAVYVEFHCTDEKTVLSAPLRGRAAHGGCGGSEEETLVARSASESGGAQFLRHAIPESVNMLIRERKKKTRSSPSSARTCGAGRAPAVHPRNVPPRAPGGNLESAVWGHSGTTTSTSTSSRGMRTTTTGESAL
jgi:D-lactate dehydrogenase (cytochrome)